MLRLPQLKLLTLKFLLTKWLKPKLKLKLRLKHKSLPNKRLRPLPPLRKVEKPSQSLTQKRPMKPPLLPLLPMLSSSRISHGPK